ncbi:probable glucan 1,3-beta-glucosidase A [Vigna unguiculata]|uniref:probable glucan 1,3-beta-glucosidase A n=1 Tax=Vigna unguiculata TaxID=3917 RepID=UPI0010160F5A|nr:probable glucan 1,3-beta-glucosidase A [Vigna unguiculata]
MYKYLAESLGRETKITHPNMTTCVNLKIWLLNLLTLSTVLSFSNGKPSTKFRVKAVNLGGWLVTEGWMKPSLFDGIPNKDFLDGTGVQFKSVTTGKYLCAESGGGTILVANRTVASGWETFRLWRINENTFRLRVFNKQFVGLDGVKVVAVSNDSIASATFHIVKESESSSRVRLKACNGYFLQAKSEEVVTADVSKVSAWEDDDPTIFVITIAARLQGEFQVTNGYGPTKAPQVMKDHWSTFIVENDFKFMRSKGLNGARIPVGWWIASDPAPPWPYVGGSLHALDNAFFWAQKYGLKIIIDLHAAPGSQNGFQHSGSRDGSLEWGTTDESINQTIYVIDFLSARYAKNPSFYAVELLNEPLSPGVTIEMLNKYYKAGYEAVRRHSCTAYVILSSRLGPSDSKELFPLANDMMRSVIDVHYYNIFDDVFENMNAQQNIDFIYTNRSSQLNNITISNGNVPLIFVGEWVADWRVKNATKEDFQRFSKAQIDVYGRATFGWAYWALKNANKFWNLEWMINNGYVKI